MKKAIIVGGGTGGHVIPAVVVAQSLEEKGYNIKWIGSLKQKNLEDKIIRNYFPSIKIYNISSGKLRRKKSLFLTIFNIYNLLDIFQIFFGLITSIFILLIEKPDFIFSKGGFVSVPVAIASKITGTAFFTHESDYTIGLANKINLSFSKKFFYSFEDTAKFLPDSKAVFSSNPIRKEFLSADYENDYKFDNTQIDEKIKRFYQNRDNKLPTILILGGSLGSLKINSIVEKVLPYLLNKFNIIHQTGDNKEINFNHPNYCQKAFIENGVAYCMKNSDLIISRSGANLVFEIIASKTPAIFIPLKSASRGEQINNANYFAKKSKLYSVIDEDTLNDKILIEEIDKFFSKEFQKLKEENLNSIDIIKIRAEQIIIDTIEKEVYPK